MRRGAGLVLGALLFATPARAAEQQLSLGPMLAFLRVDQKSTIDFGGGGMARYSYRLTDQFEVTGSLAYAVVAANQQQDTPKTARNRPAAIGDATVGAAYVLDLLERWHPWGGVEGGLYGVFGGTLVTARYAPGGSVAVGLDVYLTKHLALGLEVREHFLLTYLDTYKAYTTGLLRASFVWGR